MNSRPGYQQDKPDVPYIAASCNQRMGNFNSTITTQPIRANQNNTYHPGTPYQATQPIPTNPFLRRQTGIPWYQTQRPVTNPYALQYPGTNLHLNPISNQNGSIHEQFPGPPLFTPWPGTFQFHGNGQICEERIPNRATFQFQPATTQVNSGKLTLSRQRQNKRFVNSALFEQDDRVEKNVEEKQLKEEGSPQTEEAIQEQKENIAKTSNIKHLATSYSKVNALELLCRDLQTPVFGDFPGYEQERTIMKNLAHFLKEQINKIKQVEEEEKRRDWLENFEPIMRAPFPVIAIKIRELENKRNMLEKEKRDLQNLDKEVKNCAGELELRKRTKEVDMLRAEIEAFDTRLEAMRERQRLERRSIDLKRTQHEREMKEINKTHDHIFYEDLPKLEEKIFKETKPLIEVKNELKNWKEQNDCLRARIFETEKMRKREMGL